MAFGDDPFGGPKTNQRGRGANNNRGGGSRGGGGGNNRNNNRNRNRNRGGGGGGGVLDDSPFETNPADPFANAGAGTNPFSTSPFGGGAIPGTTSDAQPGGVGSIFGGVESGDTENYRGSAWGMLNQAGITQNPIFGSAMSDWMDADIEDMYGKWQGLEATFGADRPDWHDYFAQTVGQDPGQYFTNRFEAQSPSQRGPRARNYSGPRRVIAF